MYSFSCVHMFTQVANMFTPSPFSLKIHYLFFMLCIYFDVTKFWNILYAVYKYFALILNQQLVSDCLISFEGPRSSTPGSSSTKLVAAVFLRPEPGRDGNYLDNSIEVRNFPKLQKQVIHIFNVGERSCCCCGMGSSQDSLLVWRPMAGLLHSRVLGPESGANQDGHSMER